MNLATVHHTKNSTWNFNSVGSNTQSSTQKKDVQTKSETIVANTYVPGPHDAQLYELSQQYPEAAKDYQNGASVEQLFISYPELRQYAEPLGLSSKLPAESFELDL